MLSATREWRNWQTRRLQVPVSFGMWGFKSPLAHTARTSSQPCHSVGLRPFCRPALSPCCTGAMSLHDQLLTRADELMQNAPGRVSVRRISQIDEVKVLRSARQALTAAEKVELRNLRLQLMERLDGSVAAVAPSRAEKKKGLLGALLSPLLGAAKGASVEMRTQSEFTHMVNQAGGPARLPAPAELLDAAEAWAVSFLVADRIDDDLSVLRRSWEDATIEPVA
jgi:hypothetical protein